MNLKKRIGIAIAVFGVMTLALAGGIVVPAVLSVLDLKEKTAAALQEIEDQYARRRQSRTTAESLETIRTRVATLGDIGIIEGDELDFINSLEQAAADAGVDQKINLETANQRDISPGIREIPLKISAKGEFPRLLVYLRRLESLPYYIIVQNLDLSASHPGGTAAVSVINANLTGTVLWFADDLAPLKGAAVAAE